MTKKTKNRQTEKAMYMSIISTALCVVMLIGMTFAWFTASVESSQNVITTANFEVEVLWSDTLPETMPATAEAAVTAGWKYLDNDKYDNEHKDNSTPFKELSFLPGQEEVRYIAMYNKSAFDVKFDVSLRAVTTVTTTQNNLLNSLEFYTKETSATVTTDNMGEKKGTAADLQQAGDALTQISSSVVGAAEAPDQTVKVMAVAVKLPDTYSAADSQTVNFFIKVIASQWNEKHETTSNATVNSDQASFITYDAPAEDKPTTVAITNLDNVQDNDVLTLNVQTDGLDTAVSKFTVEEDTSAVAGIDLTLTNAAGDPVTFSGGTATITTYIAKNLTDVKVKYNGDGAQPTNVSYEPETGKLVFTTTHFSEYYVTSTSVAYVKSEDKAYDTLPAAVAAAKEDDTVILLKDVTLGKISNEDNVAISVTKNLTIDGNNNTLTTSAGRGIWVDNSNVDLTIKNLTIKGSGSNLERAIQVNGGMTGVKLTVDNVIATATYYTINICDNAGVDLTVTNSKITGWGAVNAWSENYTIKIDNCELYGVNDKGYNADGWNDFGTVILEGDTTGQTNMASNNITVEIKNTKISAATTGQGNKQWCILFNNPSADNTVRVTNCTFVFDNANTFLVLDNGIENNKLYIDGELFQGPTGTVQDPIVGEDEGE